MAFRVKIFALATLLCGLTIGELARAADVIDSYNAAKTPGYVLPRPPCCIWVPDTIGWYWTPAGDSYLTNIQTKLADVDFGYNNDFAMTVSLFTDRPAAGGTLIDSFTFNASSFVDGGGHDTFPWRGTGFAAPVSVTGGTNYFVGFQGWAAAYDPHTGNGGGINWVIDGDTGGPPADAQFLSAGYTGATFDTKMGTDRTVTAAPVIRFIGGLGAPPVPEPSTYALLMIGLAALGLNTAGRKRG